MWRSIPAPLARPLFLWEFIYLQGRCSLCFSKSCFLAARENSCRQRLFLQTPLVPSRQGQPAARGTRIGSGELTLIKRVQQLHSRGLEDAGFWVCTAPCTAGPGPGRGLPGASVRHRSNIPIPQIPFIMETGATPKAMGHLTNTKPKGSQLHTAGSRSRFSSPQPRFHPSTGLGVGGGNWFQRRLFPRVQLTWLV